MDDIKPYPAYLHGHQLQVLKAILSLLVGFIEWGLYIPGSYRSLRQQLTHSKDLLDG